MCHFVRKDGSPLRPWKDVDEMDAALLERWNEVVRPKDKVYHLGDVYFRQTHRHVLGQMNGTKVLIRGNHDTFPLKQYAAHFKDVRGYGVLDRCVLSHVPIHPQSIARFRGNIHGHLHENVVLLADESPDPRYVSVCVEHTNYAPVELSTVLSRFV
jgi:calcineurin-like phosphoesterase family protein